LTGTSEVGSAGRYADREIPVGTAAAGGVDGPYISKDLALKKIGGSRSGFPEDGS
jgi:hypothetical protein